MRDNTGGTAAPSKPRKAWDKTKSGTRKVLDLTFGNLGFGLGFGSAYAAQVPVVGAPFDSFNEGVGKGYNHAQTRILAGKVASGKMTIEEALADLDPEAKQHLATHVARAKGTIGQDEQIHPVTGEVTKAGAPVGFESDLLPGAGPAGAAAG